MKITPPYLKNGDQVGIIAPSGKLSENHKLELGINIIESWGLRVKKGQNLYNVYNSFAGSDKERASDIQNMLDDENVKAIFCARGGYGCTRIIDTIDFTRFKKSPKWIIGYSDITTLLCQAFNENIQSIHGLMPSHYHIDKSIDSVSGIRKIIFGENWKIKSLKNDNLNRKGTKKAELIGGNLSILNDLIGTKSDINTDNKILFLEEVDEYPYHIDRMFNHLLRAGKLKNLAGLIIGHFSDIKENKTNPFGKSLPELIINNVASFNYPVCFNFPIGHEPNNLPVICGREILFEVNKNGGLIDFNP